MGIVDLGVDIPVASELGHEHRDSAGDGHLAVQDREDVFDGGDGLGAGVGEEGGDAGEEGVH